MTEYTPTTEEVRTRYNADEFGYSAGLSDPCPEFDRWLEQYTRQVKAEAWDEGYGSDLEATLVRKNPYRSEQ